MGVVRKIAGAIIGFAILLGLLFTIAFYARPTLQNQNNDRSQLLIELDHSLATIDDLEQRGILSAKVAGAERQRYIAKAQIALNEPQIQALIEIKYKLATLDDLEQRGILTARVAQAERQRCLAEAQAIVGGTLDTDRLSTVLNHLDSRQLGEPQGTSPIIGNVPIPPIVWLLFGILLVAAAAWFAQPYLVDIRKRLPAKHNVGQAQISAQQVVQDATPDRKDEQERFIKRPITARLPPTRHRAKPSVVITAPLTTQIKQPSPLAESLTKRELEVLTLVAEGLTNREIAQQLIITPGTAKVHISNIYSKLGVNRRVQAVAKAQELGLLISE
jgi:DNA-binding CsgD family transcriptional regulator